MIGEQSAYRQLCDNCPTKAALEEAEAMAQANEAFYKSAEGRDKTFGKIALFKEIHFDLRQDLDCEGPVSDNANQLACPLEQSMRDTWWFMKEPEEERLYEYRSFITPEASGEDSDTDQKSAD